MNREGAHIRHKVRANLVGKGMSLQEWARRNNFTPDVARQVVYRHCGRATRPTGPKAKVIIAAIEAETGVKVCGEEGMEVKKSK